MSQDPRICDYEGSNYRADFWEGKGRDYEDLVERDVLRRLLPARGRRILEVGAGFGRLTPEYGGYEHVVLLDYSFSQLQQAREQLGDERYTYVAANIYGLPFRAGVFDGATMIRVIHHVEDVPAALRQIRRAMVSGGVFILEHANKRNLKAILRYTFGRQEWSPYTSDPVEFVEMNYNFHPDYMLDELKSAGFSVKQRFPVSFFRLPMLKEKAPPGFLLKMDRLLQYTGWSIAPSIFLKCAASGDSPYKLNVEGEAIFACPRTGKVLNRNGDMLVSDGGGPVWKIRDGIYDFKMPAN